MIEHQLSICCVFNLSDAAQLNYVSLERLNLTNYECIVLRIEVVVVDIGIAVGGLRFDSWVDQSVRSVANRSPPLRCFFGAVLSRR